MTDLGNALSGFAAAGAALLDSRELLRRVDTKFVIPQAILPTLLPALTDHYALLGSAEAPGSPYRTLYFDTEDLRCFHDHRRGRRIRDKIRIRHYDDRQLSYLEVKSRRTVTHTDKARISIRFGQNSLDDSANAFLIKHSIVPHDLLKPMIWIEFRRIMLVGTQRNERCSFDVGLSLASPCNTRRSSALSQFVFVEVKQPSLDLQAPIMRLLYDAQLRPRSASKYILSIMSEYPQLRANRFLPDFRSLQRICQ